jgi:general secretion pathway protein G
MDTPMTAPSPPHRDREAGFTLLEILVVVAILGLLIGLVAPAALRQLGFARGSIARQAIERLGTVLDLYKLDVGIYPGTDQGLQALAQRPPGLAVWNGPDIKGDAVPLDPWNHAFTYRAPSARAGHDYDLCSRGPNGAQGTADETICNP